MTNLNLNGNMTGFFLSLAIAVHPFLASWNLCDESEEEEEEELEEVRENRIRESLARNAAHTPMINHEVSVTMEEDPMF